ncbi:leucine efflux protein LeuE [Streptomyces sp. PCS3-D2]|uniref:leucine efflux protein LeuE n=1 Tax=Streptomyces sp. PCS3-D2 TaxID=1460244 RepID=UPI00044B7FFF|nr:leucine efflux protein LeuE [Streptomyces sp. PCS3-D2]WKV72240.1 leucine efflux protein LeuE [Streptomyces sp. PCS3-D2]
MLGVIDLPTYLAGLVLIILLPGPNSLYVLSVAARRGVRTGYKAAAGVFTGDAVLMALTAVGAGALLRASPLVFTVVKFLGAGYLAWLAVGMMRGAWALWRTRRDRDEARAAAPAGPAEHERPYRRALLISLLNPKAILFLMSFFVQFVSESNPIAGFVTLGVLLQLASALYLTALIFFGSRLAAAFRRRKRLSAGATSAAGVLFLGFALKLSLASA